MMTAPGLTTNQNLSGRQFGGQSKLTPSVGSYARPQTSSMQQAPLAYSAGTRTSSGAVAVWRHPQEVLPYMSSTSSSVFQPFKAAQGSPVS